jgi:monoamine oxidase
MFDVLDYAIVGGGVSGIYSGWRLLSDSPGGSPSVGLFEMSGRLGGRLLSVVPPGIPDARVELGGMRFIKNSQPLVTDLVCHLELDTEALPADQPQNIAYLRRTLLRMSELIDADKLPFNLRNDERSAAELSNLTALAAVRVLAPTIKDLLGIDVCKAEDLTRIKPEQWRIIAEQGTYDGTPLYQLPLRYLMLKSISHEAFNMAQQTSGYNSILYTWNAADGFSWNLGDYGPGIEYQHVKDGYDQLPLVLARRLKDLGGTIHLGHRLVRFTEAAEDGVMALEFEHQSRQVIVHARHLILAMPRRSLELLAQEGPLLDPANTEVHRLIRSVTPIPLFKLAICYDRPWWQDLPPVDQSGSKPYRRIEAGKSVTDLPVRQCYYWKVDEQTGNGVLLIYDDGLDLDYWASLRSTPETDYPDNPRHICDPFELPDWGRYPAPKKMVEEVHRQLVELHGHPDGVPEPYAAAYRDWGEDPYGGGANFWPVGVKSYEVSSQIIQPIPTHRVYICGDAYSHAQGWVEGALATAEEMLQKPHLGLAAPAWRKQR